jgi:hypothetical protein
MKTAKLDLVKCSFWQRVFLQSKVNGARYSGEELPGLTWNWPKDTYLQRRLRGGQIYREEKKSGMELIFHAFFQAEAQFRTYLIFDSGMGA